jgi:hypothetical protein
MMLLLAPLQCYTVAEAARQSVELGLLDEPLGSTPEIVTAGKSYINLELINVVNHQAQSWFAPGESTYVVAIEFHPFGLEDSRKWTYAKTLTRIDSSGLSGAEQNLTIGPRRVHLAKLPGRSSKPHLKVHIIELDRTNDVTPVVKELNDLLTSIPNPYTAAATTVFSAALRAYDRIVEAWLEKNKEHIELEGAGFDFVSQPTSSPPTTCRFEVTINPILGNCVYILMGARQLGDVTIDTGWARDNLRFDGARKQLVFKHAVTFPKSFGRTDTKEPGDLFNLSSYLLFRFDAQPTEFEEEAIWSDGDLKEQFSEAKRIPQIRESKWQALSDRLVTSNYFGHQDIVALQDAWQQFMVATGNCEDWNVFWYQCFKRTEEGFRKAYASLQPAGVQLSTAEIAEAQKLFVDPKRSAAAKISLAAKLRVAGVQRALVVNGFPTRDPKGVLGEETKAALKSFQLKEGLPATGAPDGMTINALKVVPLVPQLPQ